MRKHGDLRRYVLQDDLVAAFLPHVAKGDRAHDRFFPNHGKTPRRRPEQPVEGEGDERDPGDAGDDHVHRKIVAHEEDAVAETAFRGDRFRRYREELGRPERRLQGVDEARQKLGERHAPGDGEGSGAERLRLDELFARQLQRAPEARGSGRA